MGIRLANLLGSCCNKFLRSQCKTLCDNQCEYQLWVAMAAKLSGMLPTFQRKPLDVQVQPAWQRAGLGRALMERLIARLVCDNIANIALFAEPGVVGLYEKLGFIRDPQGVKGLAFQGKLPTIDPIVLL